MEKQPAACFTGHRPQKLPCSFNEDHPACLKIKRSLENAVIFLIEQKNVTRFISGAALGVDTWAMEIVLDLKEDYPNITLEAAIPCRSQTCSWNVKSKERHDRLLASCDKVTLLQEEYTPDCMMKRNKYMVDQSDYVVAVWNGAAGGTANTLRYARALGKKICRIDVSSP